MPRFIDIGANLTDPMFQGSYRGKKVHEDDLGRVLHRSREHGVERIIVTGGSLSDAKEALELVKTRGIQEGWSKGLYITVGCHPTRCTEFTNYTQGPEAYLKALGQLLEDSREHVAAIGEFGLDYDRLHFCDKETQLKYFEAQFDLAEKAQLPLFLHSRNASEDFSRIIRANRHRFSSGVVHSFTGTIEEAKELLDMDLYIGINGCSLKTEENLAMVATLPLDRIMLETDAPWCDIRPTHASYQYIRPERLPVGKKKERWDPACMVKSRNEPCTMIYVLDVVAAVKKVDPEDLAKQVWENTCKVFFPSESSSP